MDQVLHRAHSRDPPPRLADALDVLLVQHTPGEDHAVSTLTLTWPLGAPRTHRGAALAAAELRERTVAGDVAPATAGSWVEEVLE